jgi:ferric-dicitrate binding protein FerR (iron transport regulator)
MLHMNDIDELISRSLKGRTSRSEERRLLAWRRDAAENEDYFAELAQLLAAATAALTQGIPSSVPPAAAIIELAEATVEDQHLPRFRSGLPGWRTVAGMAAALVLLAVGIQQHQQSSASASAQTFRLGAGEFVTGPSETGTVTLSDGTVVRLAPRTRLRVLDTPAHREVFLSGKAYFSVAHMEGYPFRVRTERGGATALGTRFEVRADHHDLRVVVAEGRVALEGVAGRVELNAGEMSLLLDDRPSLPVQVEIAPLLGWVGNFLAFQSTPLRNVLAELEREYDTRVVLADSTLAAHTITGWYVDRSFEEVITIVCAVLGAPCSVRNGTATIGNSSQNPR